MNYKISFRSSPVFFVAWVVSLMAITGCDGPAQPLQLSSVTSALRTDPSSNVRQRDDPARNRIWILDSHGLFVYDTSTGKLLEIPLPSWHWVGMPHSCAPDVALGPEGEVVVTSNVVPVIWRIDPKTLNVSKHELALDADNNKDVGFSRMVYSTENNAYFAISDVYGSLWRIDRSLRHGQKIARVEMAQRACSVIRPRETE